MDIGKYEDQCIKEGRLDLALYYKRVRLAQEQDNLIRFQLR